MDHPVYLYLSLSFPFLLPISLSAYYTSFFTLSLSLSLSLFLSLFLPFSLSSSLSYYSCISMVDFVLVNTKKVKKGDLIWSSMTHNWNAILVIYTNQRNTVLCILSKLQVYLNLTNKLLVSYILLSTCQSIHLSINTSLCLSIFSMNANIIKMQIFHKI